MQSYLEEAARRRGIASLTPSMAPASMCGVVGAGAGAAELIDRHQLEREGQHQQYIVVV